MSNPRLVQLAAVTIRANWAQSHTRSTHPGLQSRCVLALQIRHVPLH
jgi:hypothetical protein